MSDFERWLKPQLREGYKLERAPEGGMTVTHGGQILRMPNNAPLRFPAINTHHNQQRVLQLLRSVGAVSPKRKTRSPGTRVKPRPPVMQPRNALILSQEILRDPQASPRERSMARAFQEQQTLINDMRSLVQRLGVRLREQEGES